MIQVILTALSLWGGIVCAEESLHLEDEFCAKMRHVGVPLIPKVFATPPVNRNFTGNGVTVGGVPYKRTMLVRPAWTATYFLDGDAVEFSTGIGMDDEASSAEGKAGRTIGKAEIRVDRKLVCEIKVKPGMTPLRIKIDLHGKKVLELRCNYGREFKSTNIVWIDPELKVKDALCFRENQQKWAEKNKAATLFSPVYPEAPGWKNINVRRVKFHIFENAYRISNCNQEIIILPEFGGRIIHYSRPGKPNLLYVQANKYSERMWQFGRCRDIAGGHFFRPEPQNYFIPSDPVLVHGKYSLTFEEPGVIIMRSAPSWYLGMQFEYRLKFNSDSFEVTNTIINVGDFSQLIGVWNITRVPGKNIERLLIPSEEKTTRLPRRTSAAVRKLMPDNNTIELASGLSSGEKCQGELLSFSWKAEFTAVYKSGEVLSIYTELSPEDLNKLASDKFYPVHLYIDKRFTELESHSPIKVCGPGERVSLKEIWTIK